MSLAQDVLRELEWKGDYWADGKRSCPVCHEHRPCHAPDCRLAAALAEAAEDTAGGDGWISVDEGLPRQDLPVLIVAPFRLYIAKMWIVRARTVWDEFGISNSDIPDVTHWRPLPAPPKENLDK